MSFHSFEKEDVRYTLFLGNHISSSYPLIKNSGGLKNLDVLVMELKGGSVEGILEMSNGDRQYEEIFKRLPEENPALKLYSVDCLISTLGGMSDLGIIVGKCVVPLCIFFSQFASPVIVKKISRRDLLKMGLGLSILSVILDLPALIIGSYSKETIRWLSKLQSTSSLAPPTPISGFRNAIAARIIEEYIVPNEKRPSKKLSVGILYGADHTGIEECICSKRLRDTIIRLYSNLSTFTTTKEELNTIEVITYKNGAYVDNKIRLDLF